MTAQWYALYSKPTKEALLSGQLNQHQIESYYPCVRVHPVNPRARKIKPYFPRYVFGRLDWEHHNPAKLQWMPGAAGIVSFGGILSPVPDNLISAIRRRVEEINTAGEELVDSGREILFSFKKDRSRDMKRFSRRTYRVRTGCESS